MIIVWENDRMAGSPPVYMRKNEGSLGQLRKEKREKGKWTAMVQPITEIKSRS